MNTDKATLRNFIYRAVGTILKQERTIREHAQLQGASVRTVQINAIDSKTPYTTKVINVNVNCGWCMIVGRLAWSAYGIGHREVQDELRAIHEELGLDPYFPVSIDRHQWAKMPSEALVTEWKRKENHTRCSGLDEYQFYSVTPLGMWALGEYAEQRWRELRRMHEYLLMGVA